MEAVRNNCRFEAVVLASRNAWACLFRALEEAKVILLINKRTEALV